MGRRAERAPASDALDITRDERLGGHDRRQARAQVDCKAHLNVTTDGPLKVTLADCP